MLRLHLLANVLYGVSLFFLVSAGGFLLAFFSRFIWVIVNDVYRDKTSELLGVTSLACCGAGAIFIVAAQTLNAYLKEE